MAQRPTRKLWIMGTTAVVVVVLLLGLRSCGHATAPAPSGPPSDDLLVQRLVGQALSQDQDALDGLLNGAGPSCPSVVPATRDACVLHTVLVDSVRYGFNLAVQDAATQAHRPAPTPDGLDAAWEQARAWPANRSMLAGEAGLAAFDGVCPDRSMGCIGPKAVILGLTVGVRAYRNAQRAGQFPLAVVPGAASAPAAVHPS